MPEEGAAFSKKQKSYFLLKDRQNQELIKAESTFSSENKLFFSLS